jgi:clan AA aspartic protease
MKRLKEVGVKITRFNNSTAHKTPTLIEIIMELIYAKIKLSNPRLPNLLPIELTSLMDSGALHLCISESVASQLSLETHEMRDVQTADEKIHSLPYVGPIRVDFENRFCFVGAMVIGNETLLGAVPMEDMDLVIHPAKNTLTVNPLSPNKPLYKIK